MANSLAESFSFEQFRKLLIQWVVHDNIAFKKVESTRFQQLVTYLQPKVTFPRRNTLRQWILHEYLIHKETVIQQLQRSLGQIHVSFDLWTSRSNILALNGIVAHYITNGTPKSILLALPEQNEAHTGANIAVEVLRVIHEFKINTRIGYFVLDNASNNDTCMRELAEELG